MDRLYWNRPTGYVVSWFQLHSDRLKGISVFKVIKLLENNAGEIGYTIVLQDWHCKDDCDKWVMMITVTR